jgi:hypothetical protein
MGWPGTGAEVLVQRLAGPVAEGQRALAAGEERLQILATGADQALEQLTTRGNDPHAPASGARAGWLEANAHLGPAYRSVVRELAWQRRAAGLAAEHHPPGYLREELGPVLTSTRSRRAWRQAAAAIEDGASIRPHPCQPPSPARLPQPPRAGRAPADGAGQAVAGGGRAGGGGAVRASADTQAWRRGANEERRTARLLIPLGRRGWAVLHDLAIPGSQANIDHLAIGPGGVLVVDSKQYRGRLRLDGYGMLWHGRHLLVSPLRTVRWEADQADEVLGVADVDVGAIVAVHGASVPWGQMQAEGVTVVPARRVPDLLQALPPTLGPERVAWLATSFSSAMPPDSHGYSTRPLGSGAHR